MMRVGISSAALDEGIAMMLAVWSEDPLSFPARYIPAVIENMRMLPLPVKPIPIWIGGSPEAALARGGGIQP
jgi:alkanesulfonate monooxygenase SsuD/methylene tetrahydromethanopterin reductase-like flavin-dependent oxidoreductase (luciferase family)